MAYTVRDLLTESLMEIGVLGIGSPQDPEVFQRALNYAQALDNTLAGNRRLRFTVRRETFPFVASQQDYTVGAGKNFATDRPLWIVEPAVIPVGDDVEVPLTPYETQADWLAEPMKSLTQDYPQRVRYEPNDAAYGTFTFWPIPLTVASFVFGQPVPLTALGGFNTVLTFAPGGYHEFYRSKVSQRLCGLFQRPVPDAVRMVLAEAKSTIERLNDSPPPRVVPDAVVTGGSGGYDILINRTRGRG